MKTTKKCTNPNCRKEKPLTEFYKDKNIKCGLKSICKVCSNIKTKEYAKTKNGLISIIYSSQIKSSKKRNMEKPSYSREWFSHWIYNQKLFQKLFEKWKLSNHDINLVPSVDRINFKKGYTKDNIQLMTWNQNKEKGYCEKVDEINNKLNKPIIKLSKNETPIAEYISIKEASIENNIDDSYIVKACKGERKTAGGFIWRYK